MAVNMGSQVRQQAQMLARRRRGMVSGGSEIGRSPRRLVTSPESRINDLPVPPRGRLQGRPVRPGVIRNRSRAVAARLESADTRRDLRAQRATLRGEGELRNRANRMGRGL